MPLSEDPSDYAMRVRIPGGYVATFVPRRTENFGWVWHRPGPAEFTGHKKPTHWTDHDGFLHQLKPVKIASYVPVPEHITAALEGRGGIDWRPEETLPEDYYQMSRLGRPVRYGLPEQRAFENAMRANPSDFTTAGAYADWLAEQPGAEGQEAAVRRHMALISADPQDHAGWVFDSMGMDRKEVIPHRHPRYGWVWKVTGRRKPIYSWGGEEENPRYAVANGILWHTVNYGNQGVVPVPDHIASALEGRGPGDWWEEKPKTRGFYGRSGRNSTPIRYEIDPSRGFVSALRRLRSKQQRALHSVAQDIARTLQLQPATTRDAVHDSPAGSVPSIAQAVGAGDPGTASYAAAWYGLLTRTPSLAVFHVGPDGPDSLYRWTMSGSGEDIRAQLDRAGLKSRVLLPHRTGFDVLLYDPGRRMRAPVGAFARRGGHVIEEALGRGELMGHPDPAKAREVFRSVVARFEHGPQRQSRRGLPVRKQRAELISGMLEQPPGGRKTHTMILADHVEGEEGYTHLAKLLRERADTEDIRVSRHRLSEPGMAPRWVVFSGEGRSGRRGPHLELMAQDPMPDGTLRNTSWFMPLVNGADGLNHLDALEAERVAVSPHARYTFGSRPRRQARTGDTLRSVPSRPVRYSHEAFSKGIVRDLSDPLPSLVYADWLEDHGYHEIASVIRYHLQNHAPDRGPHPSLTFADDRPDWPVGKPHVSAQGAGRHGYLVFVHYQEPHQDETGRRLRTGFYYSKKVPDRDAAVDSLRTMVGEGATFVPRDIRLGSGGVDRLQRGRPVRYQRDAFLRRMVVGRRAAGHNDVDPTAALVYADWLDEHGEDAAASIVRTHVERTGHGGYISLFGVHPDRPDGTPFVRVNGLAPNGSGNPLVSAPAWEYTVRLLHALPKNVRDEEGMSHIVHTAPMTPQEVQHLLVNNPHLENGTRLLRSLHVMHANPPTGIPRLVPMEPRQMSRFTGVIGTTKPVRYQAHSLSPGRRMRHFGGEEMFHHDILDPAGRPVGSLRVIPRGGDLHVEWVGLHGAATGEQANQLGASALRPLMGHLAEAYPRATHLTGRRTGGTRTGAESTAQRVRVPIRRMARSGQGRPRRYGREDHLALLNGIEARREEGREDVTPHLVHADYLQEQGLPHLAELIRRSVGFDERPGDDVPFGESWDHSRVARLEWYPIGHGGGVPMEVDFRFGRSQSGRPAAVFRQVLAWPGMVAGGVVGSRVPVSHQLRTEDMDLVRRLVGEAHASHTTDLDEVGGDRRAILDHIDSLEGNPRRMTRRSRTTVGNNMNSPARRQRAIDVVMYGKKRGGRKSLPRRSFSDGVPGAVG